MDYNPHVVIMNNRIKELSPEAQIAVISFINHLASISSEERETKLEDLDRLRVHTPIDSLSNVRFISEKDINETERSCEVLQAIADENEEAMREEMREENAPAFGD